MRQTMKKLLLVPTLAILAAGLSASCSLTVNDNPAAADDSATDNEPIQSVSQAICPSCSGCNGNDPSYNSCSSSAFTVFNTAYPILYGSTVWGTVEMRYSNSCGTNWSRVHSNISGQYEIEAWVEQSSTQYGYAAYYGPSQDAWSTMRYGCGISTRACGCITRIEVGWRCACTPWG